MVGGKLMPPQAEPGAGGVVLRHLKFFNALTCSRNLVKTIRLHSAERALSRPFSRAASLRLDRALAAWEGVIHADH